jgi:hypothetical protein
LMASTNSALLDSAEERAAGGKSSSFFGLGKSTLSVAAPVPATTASARKSIVIVEKNAQTIRVAYHVSVSFV